MITRAVLPSFLGLVYLNCRFLAPGDRYSFLQTANGLAV